MEEWQKKYLKSNQNELEKVTKCNEILLAHLFSEGVLANVDLETIRCRPTTSGKAQELYRILATRKDGYAATVKALTECKQTGALKILVQGFAYCLSQHTPIRFLGETKQLSEYFGQDEITEIIEQAKQKLSENPHLHSSGNPEISSEVIALVSNVEPPSASLYIPRKLFKRITVNRTLFFPNCPDIFVFKGIQSLTQLSNLINQKTAAASSAQLSHSKLTSRFVLLEADEDWEKILEITSVPTHLIKYEEETGTYVLERTTGGSNIIGYHLGRPQGSMEDENAEKVFSEDDFIDGILTGSFSGSSVCICDSPGTGKTLLLAKIACETARRCPDRLVAFISLSHFVKCVSKYGIPSEVDPVYARNSILEYITTSPVSLCILDRLIAKLEVHTELFFDGFDEVNLNCIEFTKKVLREVCVSFPNSRVFVTSRPNLRHQLEASLGVIAFDIKPFTEENKIEFFVNFWKEDLQDCVEEKLKVFAKSCLESLRCKLTKEEENITGIPLLCRLLAQVYSRNAKIFSRSTNNAMVDTKDDCIFERCLPKLYTKYIEASFEKLGDKSDCIIQVKDYHIWIAFKTLFPEFEVDYSRQLNVAATDEVIGLGLSMGALEKRYVGNAETVEFVHRTFAEYFVAQFLTDVLENKYQYSEEFEVQIARLLLKKVLISKDIGEADDFEGNIFINSVVIYFFNFLTEDLDTSFQTQILADQFPAAVCKPYQLYAMLFGCLRSNYANIFKLFQKIFPALEPDVVKKYESEMIPDGDEYFLVNLINVASVFSSIPLVDSLFTFFRECFSCNLKSVCERMPIHLDTPVHFAIERGDVEKIQYFATNISLESRNMLLSCVLKSNEDHPQIVKRKAEICKMLLGMNRDLLTEANYTLYDSIHMDLIKVLIEAGADARATKSGEVIVHRSAEYKSSRRWNELHRYATQNRTLFKTDTINRISLLLDPPKNTSTEALTNSKQTVVHCSAGYMSSSDFHELCRFLISDHKAEDLFLANEPNWKSPLPYILRKQKNLSIETCTIILDIPGVNVNEQDGYGNTLFLISVQEKHDVALLNLFAERRADLHAINVDGKNALHLAAETKNTPVLTFLINLGLNCCLKDSEGNSFLHLLPSEETTAEKYHEIVSLLSAKRITNIFHIKNKTWQLLPIHLGVDSFELTQDTLQLFKTNLVDFNAVDIAGDSVLMHAAKAGRSVQFLKTLVEMGADVTKMNKYRETFTHFISKRYSAEQYHELVAFLISNGFEKAFTTADNAGATPLHRAASHIEVLPKTLELIHNKLVKRNKVDINARDKDGWTILMFAALAKRSTTFLNCLLEMGADVMIQNKTGDTFAHVITYHHSAEEYYEIIKLLIDRGFGNAFQTKNASGDTSLHLAITFLDSHPATWDLIKKKIFETGIVNINCTDNSGFTMLMLSVLSAGEIMHIDTPIPYKIRNHSEDNFQSYHSLEDTLKPNTVVAKRAINHLRTLLDMGADIYVQDEDGNTFLNLFSKIATAELYQEIVEFLISRGEQKAFTVANNDGATPIHQAVSTLELQKKTLDLLNSALFQTNILDINSTDKKGNSVLMYAARGQRSVTFLKTLIEMSANIHLQSEEGLNFAHLIPQFYSAEQYHEIIDFLISRGEQKVLAVVTNLGMTPIKAAVSKLELKEATLDVFNSSLFKPNIVGINSTCTEGISILIYATEGKGVPHSLEI